MHCSNCGKKIEKGHNFCTQCGTPVAGSASGGSNSTHKSTPKKRPRAIRIVMAFLIGIPVLLTISIFALRFLAPDVFPIKFGFGDKKFAIAIPGGDPSSAPDAGGQVDGPQSSPGQTRQAEDEMPVETPLIDTVQPTPDPGILFSESFDAEQSALIALFGEDYMNFRTFEGAGLLSSNYSPGVIPAYVPEFVIKDFAAEYQFAVPDAYPTSYTGFLYRIQQNEDGGFQRYMALIIYPQQNQFRFGAWMGDDWVRGEKMDLPEPLNTGFTPNWIGLEVIGRETHLSVNGGHVTTYTNTSIQDAGLLGFFISPAEELPEGKLDYVLLDNFIVYIP